MSIFDDLDIDVNENTGDTSSTETNDVPSHTASLFDTFDEPEENETASETTSETTEVNTPEPTENTEPTNVENKVEKPVEEKRSATVEDIDAFFNNKYKFDEQQKLLAEYKAKEAAELEAKKAKDAEDNKMPDPLYNPEEYRKWQYEQNKSIEQRYEAKLAQMERNIVVNNITSSLDRTVASAKEKYGDDTFKEAELWAADIVKNQPEEAIEYLKNNPSWEYIIGEYKKFKDRNDYNSDPEAFIERKMKEREEARSRENANANSIKQEPVKKKTPPKSINSVASGREPEEKVPEFMKGLL